MTARLTYAAGGLVASKIKREITSYAWSKGHEAEFEEVGGWFRKVVRVSITGPEAGSVARVIHAWLECATLRGTK